MNGVSVVGSRQASIMGFLNVSQASLMQTYSPASIHIRGASKTPFICLCSPLSGEVSPLKKREGSLPHPRLLENTLNPFWGESRKSAQITRKCSLLGLHTECPTHLPLGGESPAQAWHPGLVNSGPRAGRLSRTPDVIHPSTPQKTCQDRSGYT